MTSEVDEVQTSSGSRNDDQKLQPENDRKLQLEADRKLEVVADRKLPNSAESPQLLKRAEELAKIVNNKKELYRDTETWSTHQELAKLLKTIILTDLDYALDRKVEQLLWNSCFKNYIGHLQAKTKDKRTKDRADAQVTLSWFLENGSGFYILLLEEIRLAFNLTVPFLQTGSPYGTPGLRREEDKVVVPSKASCNYICQHCLVHLGDIARYRNHIQQAETFYRHAISMAPSSGQPYNQIAILEASRSNKLSTVYFYVRAVSLSFPFTAAAINLSKLLGKLAGLTDGEHKDFRERTAKVTQHTFIPLFLRIQGLLHHTSHLVEMVRMVGMLTESLTSLVATDSLSTWQLLQMLSINMWVWEQVNASVQQHEEMAREERVSGGVIGELQAALLSSVILPVYTLRRGDELLEYYALPAIRILLEWIALHPRALEQRGFTSRPQIWPALARLLNESESLLVDFDSSELVDYPLPEEFDLQAFKPVSTSLAKYNYKLVSNGNIADKDDLNRLRCARILELGAKLSREPFGLLERLPGQDSPWRPRERQTTAAEAEDIEQLAKQIEEEKGVTESSEDEEDSQAIEWEAGHEASGSSKSILKNKEAKAAPATTGPPRYRARQNVAMAAILRANQTKPEPEEEEEKEKRVMFRSPSPNKDCASKKLSAADTAASKPSSVKLDPKLSKGWKEPAGPKSMDELDFSKPPPSLHSNFRPPALTTTLFDPAKPNPPGQVKGIQPILPQAAAKPSAQAAAAPPLLAAAAAPFKSSPAAVSKPSDGGDSVAASSHFMAPTAGSSGSYFPTQQQPLAAQPPQPLMAANYPAVAARPGPFLPGIGDLIRQSGARAPEQYPALSPTGVGPAADFSSRATTVAQQYPNMAGLNLGWKETPSPTRQPAMAARGSSHAAAGGQEIGVQPRPPPPTYSLFSGSPWGGASILTGADTDSPFSTASAASTSPFSTASASPSSASRLLQAESSPSLAYAAAGFSGSFGSLSSPNAGGGSPVTMGGSIGTGVQLSSPTTAAGRFVTSNAGSGSPGASLLERLVKQNERGPHQPPPHL